jgi:uncharacterized protein
MTSIIAAALSLALQQSAVPPPVEQFTADCATPVYASDQLICSDPELLEAEAQIVELWRIAQPDWSVGPYIEQQDAWFRRRALCAFQTKHRACLVGANAERIAVLSSATQGPEDAVLARCIGSGGSRSVSLSQSGGSLAAYDQGHLVWLAVRPNTDWTPFVSWAGGRSLRFRPLDGTALTCRLR